MSKYIPSQAELATREYRAVYFPMEGKWAVFSKEGKLLTGFFDEKFDALIAAFYEEHL